MKAVYIGTLTPGSTSRMRAEQLRHLNPSVEWEWIDTDAVMLASPRIWQSAAYRLKSGKAVQRINDAVVKAIAKKKFDLAWVDKAIFLRPPTVRRLRQASAFMVHFTPDTAFHAGRSKHFEKTASLYDVLVTTKSFDVPEYLKLVGRDTVHLTTQGFDVDVHFPRNTVPQRRKEVVFVGLAEPDRERCITTLLKHGISVRLAGVGWDGFLKRNAQDDHLKFEGESAFSDRYAELFSHSWIGLGLLTKRFRELHTTRTFEIPACGAVLATEVTSETERFFSPDEAIFFRDYEDLAKRVVELFKPGNEGILASIASGGRRRVHGDGRDYRNILQAALTDPRLEPLASEFCSNGSG